MNKKIYLAAFAAVLSIGILAGCASEEKTEGDGGAATTGGSSTGSASSDSATDDSEALGTRIKSTLYTTEGVSGDNIEVVVIDTTVKLKGSVESEDMKKKAEEAAKASAGSKYNVDVSELTVKAA